MNDRTAEFQACRPKLYGIAYRMLGSRADAEDILQEAFLRWHRADGGSVRNPHAWLTTAVTRLCIDRLRAVQAERRAYYGPWLPEPLVGEDAGRPDRASELASDLSVAFLLLLERLAPRERAAFLLHEVFDCGYGEIAPMLGVSEANCRQIVRRARQRVQRDRPRFEVTDAARRRLLETFHAALQAGDRDALLALFAPDATWIADGGGKAVAASKAVHGAARIAKLLAGVGRRLAGQSPGRISAHLLPINGHTGLVTCIDGRPRMAISIETDGSRILAGYNVVNPDKLHGIARHLERGG
ncbi:MAG: RNA polymerase sigma-70 factor [Gammaproteobacteria bacterium]